jgi:two-component system cell cycle sensor histidine kinase/response regulator CckA
MGNLSERNHADQLFLTAIESCPNAMVMVNQEGRIVLVNSQAEKIFGYTREELMGQALEGLLPDFGPVADERDLLAQRKDGTRFPVEIALNPIETAEGKWVLRWIVDITERKQAEERFRLAVESSPSAMVMVDHTGKIVLVNSQLEKLFGYNREELMGQTVEILVPEPSRQNHPALRGEYLANPRARPMGAGPDVLAQRKDGRLIPVEIGLNPIETRDGICVLSSIVDITERKRAEATLGESEERFRNMADTAPVMIWVAGPDKLCTFFNKVWLKFTGRTMEQELGNGWAEGVHPDDIDRCVCTYHASFDSRSSFQMEYRLRRADGEYRWILDDGVPRFTPSGVFAGYIGSCIDITEVKRTLKTALASQKLESVGQLAAGIAHDFNNLLGGILASADLALGERGDASSSPREELIRIRTAAIRGGEIVRQLMIYSGNESPVIELVDVSLLVGEMLDLLKVSISKHALLETDLRDGLPAVHANPAQIRQVVMNLVTNASEAIAERYGVIRVTTMKVKVGKDAAIAGDTGLPAGDYLKLEVSDTGDGITPEVQARLFDPFFTTKFSGRGLGLAMVQGIVRGHAGAIDVVSAWGRGTRFTVLLPCTNQRARDLGQIAAPASTGQAGSVTGTVLMVEDEELLRLPVAKMLRTKGFAVIEAIDGGAAIHLFQANAADISVVLLDMTLPVMSGSEVFAELRRIRPDVKVILTSAYSQGTVLTAVAGQQPWDFVRKPYRLNQVLDLIRDACTKRGVSGRAAG